MGIVVAAAGGALLYHALFVEPPKAELVTNTGAVRELPNMIHVICGALLLVIGAGAAFFLARRQR